MAIDIADVAKKNPTWAKYLRVGDTVKGGNGNGIIDGNATGVLEMKNAAEAFYIFEAKGPKFDEFLKWINDNSYVKFTRKQIENAAADAANGAITLESLKPECKSINGPSKCSFVDNKIELSVKGSAVGISNNGGIEFALSKGINGSIEFNVAGNSGKDNILIMSFGDNDPHSSYLDISVDISKGISKGEKIVIKMPMKDVTTIAFAAAAHGDSDLVISNIMIKP